MEYGTAIAGPQDEAAGRFRRTNLLTRLSALLVMIDPKPLTLESIRKMLASAFPDKVTLATASSKKLPGFQDEAASTAPPLVVLYIRNAGVSDGWVQQELRLIWERFPAARVTLLSDRDEADEVAQAISCGVRGYLPTSLDYNLAVAALRIIDVGGTYIPAHVVGALPGEPHRLPQNKFDLTDREIAVARLLAEGRPNKVIANALKIEPATVKVHVRNILKKFQVANRTQAAIVAENLLALPTFAAGAAQTNESPADD